MGNCIMCGLPLSDIEIMLNMNFHSNCSTDVIKKAWALLEETNDNLP